MVAGCPNHPHQIIEPTETTKQRAVTIRSSSMPPCMESWPLVLALIGLVVVTPDLDAVMPLGVEEVLEPVEVVEDAPLLSLSPEPPVSVGDLKSPTNPGMEVPRGVEAV